MDPAEFRSKIRKPESKIQSEIIDYLKLRDWFVRPVGPSAASCGWPDLYCAHFKWGYRWIEVKNPEGYQFTPAQIETFPLLHAKNIGVWVLTSADEDEMAKIFKPANWWHFLSSTSVTTRRAKR